MTPEQLLLAQALLDEGRSNPDVARLVGVTQPSILNNIRAGRLRGSIQKRGPSARSQRLMASAQALLDEGLIPSEVVRRLGISSITLKNWIRDGRVVALYRRGHRAFLANGSKPRQQRPRGWQPTVVTLRYVTALESQAARLSAAGVSPAVAAERLGLSSPNDLRAIMSGRLRQAVSLTVAGHDLRSAGREIGISGERVRQILEIARRLAPT